MNTSGWDTRLVNGRKERDRRDRKEIGKTRRLERLLRNPWQKLRSICKLLLLQALVCHFYKLEPGGRFTSDVYLEAVCTRVKFYRVCIYSKHACFTYHVMNLSMMRFRRTTRSFRTIGTRTYVRMHEPVLQAPFIFRRNENDIVEDSVKIRIVYCDVASFISSTRTTSKVANDELLPTD